MKDTKALVAKLEDAMRHMVDAEQRFMSVEAWRHYKGGLYKVEGFEIDTDDESIRVRYRRIDGPGFKRGLDDRITWSRPLAEWFDKVSTRGCAGIAHARFEPVYRIERYETKAEIEARDGLQ